MGPQGYDFDERLSQNGIHEVGRLAPSIVNSDSCPADQFYPMDPEREPIQFDRGETLSAEHVSRRLALQSSKAAEKKVMVVGSLIFLRECIQRSIQSALSIPVETFSSFSEMGNQETTGSARLVIISLGETNTQESAEALSIISDLAPSLPTIVLSSKYDFEVMRAVIGCGAKGYIPMTMGFEITVEAVRFVLAGGTYVPAECLLSAILSAGTPSRPTASGAITGRELAVVRAIHQGKPNKIIWGRTSARRSTDIVGYSRLAGADEDRTLARMRGLRSDLIDPAIAAHHGRIVKRTGDWSLIEFRSVVDAVRCAIEVQNGLIERNAGVPPERRIEFRVGIHLGDVVEESDGDLMGDGVNIAARLESIANPGTICLSEDAYRQVKGRLDLAATDLGSTQLKNIAEPIRVYSLDVGQPARPKLAPAPAPEKSASPRLSIVVLPFANIGGDPEQEHFVDGVTESLTTDLSRIRHAVVIGRNTAFT